MLTRVVARSPAGDAAAGGGTAGVSAGAGPAAGADRVAELEVKLASASLDLADRLLHAAFQEMEAAMFEQVSNRLRAELPELIADILKDHFADDD